MKNPIIIIMLLLSVRVFGQSTVDSPTQGLKIGDKIPNLTVVMLNKGEHQSYKIQDLYEHGLLIMNFWATWCVPCVSEQPRLNQLLAANQNSLRLLSISNESRAQLDAYLSRHPGLDQMAFITDDQEWSKIFPHRIIPHNIWIDKTGTVRAITDDSEITQSAIANFLKGNVKMVIKEEDLTFDWRKPLSIAENALLKKSTFAPFNKKINAGIARPDFQKPVTRLFAWNRPKTELLWASLFPERPIQKRDYKLVKVHVKDPSGFYFPKYTDTLNWMQQHKADFEEWAQKNLYTYELVFNSNVDKNTFYQTMANEVQNFFSVDAQIKNRPTECWILRTDRKNRKPAKSSYTDKKPFKFSAKNVTDKAVFLDEIVDELNKIWEEEPPIINETKIEYPIDLNLSFGETTEEGRVKIFFEYLNTLGISVSKGMRQQPNLVITGR